MSWLEGEEGFLDAMLCSPNCPLEWMVKVYATGVPVRKNTIKSYL
jgi:hypothetical protein